MERIFRSTATATRCDSGTCFDANCPRLCRRNARHLSVSMSRLCKARAQGTAFELCKAHSRNFSLPAIAASYIAGLWIFFFNSSILFFPQPVLANILAPPLASTHRASLSAPHWSISACSLLFPLPPPLLTSSCTVHSLTCKIMQEMKQKNPKKILLMCTNDI